MLLPCMQMLQWKDFFGNLKIIKSDSINSLKKILLWDYCMKNREWAHVGSLLMNFLHTTIQKY